MKFFEGLERFALIQRGAGEVAARRIAKIAKKEFARARTDAVLVLPRAGVSKLIKLGGPATRPERLAAVVKELCGVREGEPEDAWRGDDAGTFDWFRETEPLSVTTGGVELSPLSVKVIRDTAARVLEEVLSVYPVDKTMPARLRKYSRNLPETGSSLREMVLTVTGKDQTHWEHKLALALGDDSGVMAGGSAQRDAFWLAQRNTALAKLATEVLPGLWAVTKVDQAFGDRDEVAKLLESSQRRIGEALGAWFAFAEQLGWSFNLRDTIRPLTLALYKTLAELADTDPSQPGPSMNGTLVLLDKDGKEKARYSLVN